MPIQWDILANAPNPGSSFAAGFQNGRQIGRQYRQDSALNAFARDPSNPQSVNALIAANPELGLRMAEYQRGNQKREALGHLFDPEAAPAQNALAAPTQNALAGFRNQPEPPPPVAMNPDGSPPAAVPPAAHQGVLLDPLRLPPRTDGLALNHDALRTLYRLDPESAIAVQRHVFSANQAQFKEMQQRGAQMASVAYHLKQLPAEQRGAELQAMLPQLAELGFTPEQIGQADLSDTGLDRYIVTGRAIGDILRDDRAERRFQNDVSDDEADNERADRNTESMISHRGAQEHIAERGQNIASGDRRRGQDQTDARGRRGQDMTDKRVRESAAFRGARGKGGAAVPTATNPHTGQKMEYRGGKWSVAQ